ncbi:BgTH12-05948 [Blumeria graminis f. sp. triticale]|uniref:DNA replication complex GINS protein SLD5 n=3 Tax=Blumeria graminis TaxID=34373 RepID=A0A381LJQ1_BLUGR|nr:Subunit of the GINS complex [Blumeria graminis f. sp. tritici 96224]CAD6504214.1 BgTH12-05948 [Blumeria graminis f. sp. triticale]VDB91020.1 Bgt-1567 [Blumeria graminis f. sp. tritici]
MEISDFIENIINPASHVDSLADSGAGLGSREGTDEKDQQALTRAWVNERGTVGLLPPQDALISRCSTRIRAQIEMIERMTGDMDPKTNFSLIIIQTDVERWKFLIRSYLRARLAKVDKYTLYYLSSPQLQTRLSKNEMAYATRHQQLLHNHYLNCFLGSFPANLQNLNDAVGGISMVEGPDEDSGVFVRGLGGRKGEDSVVVMGRGRDADGEVEVTRGEVVVAKWSDVREFIEREEMELV